MNRGFQKPIDPGVRKKVGLAIISYNEDETVAICSCGKPFVHPRRKVREDRIDEHIATKHNGKGVRT